MGLIRDIVTVYGNTGSKVRVFIKEKSIPNCPCTGSLFHYHCNNELLMFLQHVKRKYAQDEDQRSLLLNDTPIPSFKLDPPMDDVFIEKYIVEDQQESPGVNMDSNETCHSISRLSSISASNVDLFYM